MARHRATPTPLIALDAVVIDTETTGLDPAKARIVEIAGGADRRRTARCRRAVPLAWSGRTSRSRPQRRDPRHRRRHGRRRAAVCRRSGRSFVDFIGGAVLIGHTVGFDLAVLKRECERAGLPWPPPRTLDTRLLAEIAEPDLAGYSLESLAAWLGVEIADRHSALGDAVDRRADVLWRWCRSCASAASARWPKRARPAARSPTCSTSSTGPAGSSRSRRRRASMPSARSAASTAIPTAIASAT